MLLACLSPVLAAGAYAQATNPGKDKAQVKTNEPDIPVLNWIQRSDWMSVKDAQADDAPGAVGDGVADDTAAIQAVLDKIKTGATVYFPAGTYRITKSLSIGLEKQLTGINVLGHGRDTILSWDGEEGGDILIVDGSSMSRYMGLTFEGNHKAARGYYSYNIEKGSFITELQFRDLAFKNFTQAAIYYEAELKSYTKTPDKFATAEIVYDNCLFVGNKLGVYSASFNDLNHTYTGCEFRDNGIGIQYIRGNYYVRNTHFARSTEVDIQSKASEHGSSVRRVTSTGSKMFVAFGSSVGVFTLENCRVSNWTNPNGAVHIRAPSAMLFDNIFKGSDENPSEISYMRQSGTRLVSNNKMFGTNHVFFGQQTRNPKRDPVAKPDDAPDMMLPEGYNGKYLNVIEIPFDGATQKPVDIKMDQSFLKTTRELPGKVFDAKVDFGAQGNGKGDDTEAIQKTIDAAREHGDNAIAYIPAGRYNINKTLHITGENYQVGGTGYGSGLQWNGEEGGVLMQVKGPQNVVIEGLAVGQADFNRKGKQAVDILQVGVDGPSSVMYERVLVYGRYMRNTLRGMHLKDLGPQEKVLIEEVQGNLKITDSADATILATSSYEGALTIEGASKKRDGFTGFLTRLATGVSHALIIKNNQSAVLSDFYVEQAPSIYSFEGTPDDPAGRVTIQSPKIDATGKKEQMAVAHIFDVDGFTGDIFLGPSSYYVNPREMRLDLRGNAKADLYFIGTTFYESGPEFVEHSPSIKIHWLGTRILGNEKKAERLELVKDTFDENNLVKLNNMLDDLRKLGTYDINTNFPGLAK